MRPWLAALVAFVFLGPYLSTSWELAEEIDGMPPAPVKLTVAQVSSFSFERVAWVSVEDAVLANDRAVRLGRQSPWTPVTGAGGAGSLVAFGEPPSKPGPLAGLLYRAKKHEVKALTKAGFFGPAGAPAGPVLVVHHTIGPDHLAFRKRLGVGFQVTLVMLWALLWGIARAMKPREPVSPTDVRWGTTLLLLWGTMVLVITPADGPAPFLIRASAAVFVLIGLALLAFAGTRPVLAAVNWLDGARARRG